MNNIWIICCEQNNLIDDHICQMLGKARQMRCNDVNITAVFIGKYTDKTVEKLFKYGADEIILCEMEDIQKNMYSKILCEMTHKNKPDLIFFPSNDLGKYCASELAIQTGAGLTADCIDVDIHEDEYIFSRAALNDSVIAKIKCINTDIRMCTVKKNVFTKHIKTYSDRGKVHIYNYSNKIIDNKIKLLSREVSREIKNNNLENSKIIFGFGRGISDDITLELLKQAALRFNAKIAGSRAVVEEGKIGKEYQIGQSGISVAPVLYVAFGISGASQHMVGIKNAKKIIAVNSDPDAPIFDYSDYSIIGDCNEILQELNKISIYNKNELKELL